MTVKFGFVGGNRLLDVEHSTDSFDVVADPGDTAVLEIVPPNDEVWGLYLLNDLRLDDASDSGATSGNYAISLALGSTAEAFAEHPFRITSNFDERLGVQMYEVDGEFHSRSVPSISEYYSEWSPLWFDSNEPLQVTLRNDTDATLDTTDMGTNRFHHTRLRMEK